MARSPDERQGKQEVALGALWLASRRLYDAMQQSGMNTSSPESVEGMVWEAVSKMLYLSHQVRQELRRDNSPQPDSDQERELLQHPLRDLAQVFTASSGNDDLFHLMDKTGFAAALIVQLPAAFPGMPLEASPAVNPLASAMYMRIKDAQSFAQIDWPKTPQAVIQHYSPTVQRGKG